MINSRTANTFSKIDLGTSVTTTTMDRVYITVDPGRMMHDYADAILHELERRNPIKYQALLRSFDNIVEDAHYYMDGLVNIRIQTIQGNCPVWRKAKYLKLPAVVQDALSCLGVITDRNHGFQLVPVLKGEAELHVDIDRMMRFSDFMENFESDGLKLYRDAMPRGIEGDVDTMSCIIIGDEVKSMKVDAHPTFSYIAAFLGLEAKDKVEERRFDVRYDLFSYIQFMLLQEIRKCSF